MTYKTPIKDIRFALENIAGFGALEETGAFEDLSDDLVEAILEEMGRFCDEIIAPLNVESDKHGAAMVDGVGSLLTMFYGLTAAGLWREERGSNILDGGAPFPGALVLLTLGTFCAWRLDPTPG